MFVAIKKPAREQKQEPGPYASINRRGEIVLNFAAIKLLMAWERYTLHYDAETNRLGIRRASSEDDRSLRVFRARRYGRHGRLRVIRAGRFLKQLGIDITRTLVFSPPTVDDRMIVLDLNLGGK
jgi:hypothetical protein